ncbi:MAG: twin-arginine translocation pathway signal protein [Pseudomonadota bacterium]
MKRRNALAVVGGGIILAAGGVAGFLATRDPARALAPWQAAGSLYEEPRRRALSFAILAPNPHNRQPWLVDLATPGEIRVFADQARRLPETDPFDRQITIGLGCFLALLEMAAGAHGYRAEIVPFPDGAGTKRLDERPVASVRLIEDPAAVTDPLFAHVLTRRSLKEPYDTRRVVPAADLVALRTSAGPDVGVGTTRGPSEVAALRALTGRAIDLEFRTRRTLKESIDLLRIGKAEIEANPDGIDLGGPMFELLAATGQLSKEAALDPASRSFQGALDAAMQNVNSAMAHLWLTTAENRRVDQLGAGRAWLRVNLAATAAGLGTQPLSQALQEFPEMSPLYREVHDRLAPGGGTVQMLARLGYGPTVGPSPRWALKTRIVTA